MQHSVDFTLAKKSNKLKTKVWFVFAENYNERSTTNAVLHDASHATQPNKYSEEYPKERSTLHQMQGQERVTTLSKKHVY